MGREGKSHASFQEIFKLFEDAIQNSPHQSAANMAAASAAASGSQTTGGSISLTQNYDPLWIAQQKLELKIGNFYFHQNAMWRLLPMDQKQLTLEAAGLFQSGTTTVATSACVKELKAAKTAPPYILEAQESEHHQCTCQDDLLKADAWILLQKAANKLEPKSLWKLIGLEPTSKKVYTLQKLKAEELCLVPCTDAMTKIVSKAPAPNVKHGVISMAGLSYYVLQPKIFKPSTAEKPASGCTVPFWWVDISADAPNMVWKEMQYNKDCFISCLVNPKVVNKNVLLIAPPKSPEATAAEPAKKKAKN